MAPLLRSLLAQLRRSRQTPLQFGIDSEAMAAAALRECRTSDERRHQTRDWQFATSILDKLVARFLEPHVDGCEVGFNSGTGGAERGMDQSLLTSAATSSDCATPTIEATAPHPLALWLERLHAVMSAVQPRAVEIVALRVEGFRDRDIAERLGLGLRLVKRIIEDAGANWERATRSGATTRE